MINIHILGEFQSERHIFRADELTIGRTGDLQVPDEAVSHKHCRIVQKGDKIIVIDLQSSNGTFVNGKRVVAPQVLGPSDIIEVGTTKISVEIPQPIADDHPTPINDPASSTQLPTIDSEVKPRRSTPKPRSRSAIERDALGGELRRIADALARRLAAED